MSFYPPKISERFDKPENAGKAKDANAVGTNATFVCGAVLRLSLRIENGKKQILEAKFQTNGCGFLIAAAETLTKKIAGKSLVDFHGAEEDFFKFEIEIETGEFPPARAHCQELAVQSLQSAFADFRRARIEEWTGEKALVCSCFGVSEETVENLIAEQSIETVEEVTEICRAGGGCGSCRFLIEDILDVYRREKL